jgi:putative molybdopterin biosynthesis protein
MAKIYLEDIPLEEAQTRFEDAIQEAGMGGILGTERMSMSDLLLDRVLAETVWARISSPHYHGSAMDGFAVRAESTNGALETDPLSLDYGGDAVYLDTGDPLPDWADAVIPIENVEPLDEREEAAADPRKPDHLRIRAAISPWANVREMGEDMVATQLVLPSGREIRPVELGAAAGCGYESLLVSRKPKVAIIPTGTELVYPGEPLNPGDIIEYNAIVLAAQVREWGGEPQRMENTPDDFQRIRAQVLSAAQEHDLVLLIAGSSAGSEDYSARVVEDLGRLLVHGVAVRPGHPVILGMIDLEEKSIPIVGVPGFPVSAALTGEIFIKPLLEKWLGKVPSVPKRLAARITRKINSRAGDDEYLRVAVGFLGDKTLAAPLSRGSGVITSLVRADGLVIIPRGEQGLQAGDPVTVQLYQPREVLEGTIFAIGSHDLTLDLMAQYLANKQRRLTSVNVGSLGGILALKRGETHLAGSHLLDPESGEYNIAYLKQYVPDLPLRIVTLVGRTQGLFLAPGNPKNIKGLEDLDQKGISFVNRQRGSGTRLLLDYHLEQKGISPEDVQGYEHEEFTHLAAAALVKSGRADCALGIEAASYALDLDFLPLFTERYDLIVPLEYVESDLLAPLFELLSDDSFRAAVRERPGYDTSQMGRVVADFP